MRMKQFSTVGSLTFTGVALIGAIVAAQGSATPTTFTGCLRGTDVAGYTLAPDVEGGITYDLVAATAAPKPQLDWASGVGKSVEVTTDPPPAPAASQVPPVNDAAAPATSAVTPKEAPKPPAHHTLGVRTLRVTGTTCAVITPATPTAAPQ